MVSIDSLPREVLAFIVEYLTPEERECVALTLNKILYNATVPRLAGLFERKRNAKRMIARFGKPYSYGQLHHSTLRLYRQFIDPEALEPEALQPRNRKVRLNCLDHLELDGSFRWLEPLDPVIENNMRCHWPPTAAASPEHAADVEAQAKKLGLSLPPGFLHFIQNKELQRRIPSTSANFFELGSKFIRASGETDGETDGGNNGYVIIFHIDQQHCAYWMLYLDPEGGCCVLTQTFNPESWDDEEPDEVPEGGRAGLYPGQFRMAAPGFEEYLAWEYLDGGNAFSVLIQNLRQHPNPTDAQLRFCVRSCTGRDTYDPRKHGFTFNVKRRASSP